MFTTKFRADDQGRFTINPYAGDYFRLRAFPARGPALPGAGGRVRLDQGGGQEGRSTSQLPRGVLIRGKVTEEGTGRPVAGASVQFFPRKRSGDVVHGFEAIVASKEDGSFQVAVPPGKGHLMVLGPTLDYIPQEIGGGKALRKRSAAAAGGSTPTPSSPTRSRPASASASSPRRSGRARRSGAAWSARRGRRSTTR